MAVPSTPSRGTQLGHQHQQKARVAAAQRWLVITTALTFFLIYNVPTLTGRKKGKVPKRNNLRDLNANRGSSSSSSSSSSCYCPPPRIQKSDSTSYDTLPRSSRIFFPNEIPTPAVFHTVKQFTAPNYEKFMTNLPGKEHYALLYYLSSTYGDERPIIDIGTRFVASSLAFAVGGSSVKTYDQPDSNERSDAFRGISETEWQSQVQAHGISIEFNNVDLLKVDLGKTFGSTWLISLDTNHLPDSFPFERAFFLKLIETGYQGIVLLDDIYFNNEMKIWWKEVKEDASKYGYRTFDVSKIGHYSGTGIVDFSGRVVVEFPQPEIPAAATG